MRGGGYDRTCRMSSGERNKENFLGRQNREEVIKTEEGEFGRSKRYVRRAKRGKEEM